MEWIKDNLANGYLERECTVSCIYDQQSMLNTYFHISSSSSYLFDHSVMRLAKLRRVKHMSSILHITQESAYLCL